MFDAIEEALHEFRNGNPILVVDDESRENEGEKRPCMNSGMGIPFWWWMMSQEKMRET